MDKKKFEKEMQKLLTPKTSHRDLFSLFTGFCKIFVITLFKKIFSKENKEKVKRAVIYSAIKIKQAILFVIFSFVHFFIFLKDIIFALLKATLDLSRKTYAVIFSDKNIAAVRRGYFYTEKKANEFVYGSLGFLKKVIFKSAALIKALSLAAATSARALQARTFSEENKQYVRNSAVAFKDKSKVLTNRSALSVIYTLGACRHKISSLAARFLPYRFRKFPGIILPAGAAFAGSGLLILGFIYFTLPGISAVKYYHPDETTEIYDINHKLLAKIHNEENRIVISSKDLPEHVKNAVIAMEDERFYEHSGVDLKAISRSAASLILPGTKLVKGGGSTITQQLARNIYLTKERKLSRKVQEILMAIKLERNLSKEKILDVYLNEVYWGHNAYGIEAAAKTYFGKPARDLSLAEASLIGGLLSGPEIYSPYKNMKLAKWRQSLTLENMLKNNFISGTDAELAKRVPVRLYNTFQKKKSIFMAPYFSSYVISILEEKYGDNLLSKGGLKVYTTINLEEQQLAEKILLNEVKSLNKYNVSQGGLVSVEPYTGFIRAMVGGVDYEKSQFNRITQAYRQPGSAFKPLVYLTAFKEKKVTPNTYIKDEPISYSQYGGKWSPQNYNGRFRGQVTVKEAVKYSVNTVAVKVLEKVGVGKVMQTAKTLGIESKLTPNLSLALGTSEVSPLELVSAYSTFATGGKKFSQPTPILRIQDKDGKTLEDFSKPVLTQVYDRHAVSMLDQSLKAVVSKGGTGHAAAIPGYQVAGKTGTTSNNKDSWFIGYIPKRATLVWLGNDNNSGMMGATGGQNCAPIWKKYMMAVLPANKPVTLVKNKQENADKFQLALLNKPAIAEEEESSLRKPVTKVSRAEFAQIVKAHKAEKQKNKSGKKDKKRDKKSKKNKD